MLTSVAAFGVLAGGILCLCVWADIRARRRPTVPSSVLTSGRIIYEPPVGPVSASRIVQALPPHRCGPPYENDPRVGRVLQPRRGTVWQCDCGRTWVLETGGWRPETSRERRRREAM